MCPTHPFFIPHIMKDKLLTPSYALIIAANFLQFFGFWLLMPATPLPHCVFVLFPAIFWIHLPENRYI